MPPAHANAELLRALAKVLKRLRLRWYLFGAQAVVLHGRPRMTEDVDVTVEVTRAQLGRLVAALTRAGFLPRIDDVATFVARAHVIPFLHRKSGFPVDVVVAGDGLEKEFLERTVAMKIGGSLIPVLAPDDLVITKIIAGRAKDLDDVEGVFLAQPALDRKRIRRILAEVDAALGENDLVIRFDTIASRRKKRR